ncbi:PepSY-associated TM helix domain-containing protein [Rubrimonas cliftonensis]|uniref:Uncharacterized iron-regulated membrane protein n=1 Tax=Rubrimonas cliftonensis TaxID=89524 RepID=A0A1H4F0U2_9RHOB|nr:PepSY-associated TM helix domain-containing protein [Rubrimonas cliftonensis]SEA90560.1 Uncharacterized iron-regulated membrane protein [Rubrimonas cliftonensis]
MLSPSVTKRLIALHGWSGTVLSILLYVVMLTGAVIVFDDEILRWSRDAAPPQALIDRPIHADVAALAARVPPALRGEVLIAGHSSGHRRVAFTGRGPADAEPMTAEFLLDRDGAVVRRLDAPTDDLRRADPHMALERFIVDLHVQLHLPAPWGLYATGVLGLTMLVAAISGALIHRHLVRDAFLARRPGGRVASARDAHVLAGVWGLPFAALLAFTGAFLSFALSLGLPIVAMVAFGGDQRQALEAVLGAPRAADAAPGPLADLDAIVADAARRADAEPLAVTVEDYGARGAEVRVIHAPASGALTGATLVYDGATGGFVREHVLVGAAPSLGSALVSLAAPLHFGTFAGLLSRAVWAGLGAAMTYAVVSGVDLWLRRREGDQFWAVCRRAMVCVVWGLPFAMACAAVAFFATVGVGTPWTATPAGFLTGCALAVGWTCLARRGDAAALGRDLRAAAGAALLVLPLIRVAAGGAGWPDALWTRDPAVAGIDLAVALLGLWLLAPALRAAGEAAFAAARRSGAVQAARNRAKGASAPPD